MKKKIFDFKIGDLLEVNVALIPDPPLHEIYMIIGSYVKENFKFWRLFEMKSKRIISSALEDSYLKQLSKRISL